MSPWLWELDGKTLNVEANLSALPLAGQTLGSEGDNFVIAEWHDPGGTSEKPRLIAPRHLHHHDDEAWYVLEGTLHIEVGSRIVEAHTGSAVFVQRGMPHTYWNPGPSPARYLLVMTGNIHRLIKEIHALKDRSRPALEALFRQFDAELLG